MRLIARLATIVLPALASVPPMLPQSALAQSTLAQSSPAQSVMAPTAAPAASSAGPSAVVLGRVAPAILRVVASHCAGEQAARAGSGFAWPGAGQVVTDLHVVAGCDRISVGYQDRDDRPARVVRVYVAADLALLTVDHPPDVPTLAVAPDPPPVGTRLEVFGFALGQPSRDAHPLEVTFASQEAPRLSDALPDDLRTEIRRVGFPALDTEVLRLDGNLLPGHSGAPLLDAEGRVVAIGSGGLERGAVGVGWAVRAQYLARLLTSADAMPAAGAVERAAFATPEPGHGTSDEVLRCGGLTLIRRRVVPLRVIAASADDPAMLRRLSDAAGVTLERLANNRFAIWTEPDSAAGIVLPIGLPLRASDELCVIPSLVPSVRYLLRVVPLAGAMGQPGWGERLLAERRRSLALIQQTVGVQLRADQPDMWLDRHRTDSVFTVRGMFRARDDQGQGIRLYRSDAAGNGAYIMAAVVQTDVQTPEPALTDRTRDPPSTGARTGDARTGDAGMDDTRAGDAKTRAAGTRDARARDAWARGVFAINLSGFPPSK